MLRYYLGWLGLGYSSGLQDLAAWNLHSISFGAACLRQCLDCVPERCSSLSSEVQGHWSWSFLLLSL